MSRPLPPSPCRLALMLAAAVLISSCAEGTGESAAPREEPRPDPAATAAPAAAPRPSLPVPAAPPLPPDLSLIGTSSGARGAGAFFALADGEQRYVRMGRRVAPGWTLARVGPGEAVLSGGTGTERVLRLAEDEPDTGGAGPSAATAADEDADAQAEAEADRLTALLRLGIEPATAASGAEGHRFTGTPPPVLAAAGIQRGDILISYDGESFDRGEDVDGLVYLLGTRARVGLEIERGGTRMEITARPR